MGQKQAVALIIFRGSSEEEVVSVKRPEEDEDYPGEWGFPMTTVGEDEDWEEAVDRAAEKKLGTEAEIQELMSEGGQARDGYNIVVRNYRVDIGSEEDIDIEENEVEGTEYEEWAWRPLNAFRDDAEGSDDISKTMLLDYMDYMFDKPHNIFKMEHQD